MDTPLACDVRTTVGVLGCGAWGTSLAAHAARMGHDTMLYTREPALVQAINDPAVRENTKFLVGHKLPPGLVASGDQEAVVKRSELILLVVPTPYLEATMAVVGPWLREDQIMVACCKGIICDTLETPDMILKRVLPQALHSRLTFLSGPSFAAEVAAGKALTAVTIASANADAAKRVQAVLSTPRFRCYWTDDVVGVEMGGAIKNVLAVAVGASDSLGYGANGRAALITRGLSEMTRLAVARGANPLTMGGLAGVGDLVLTCTGDLSRNRSVGLRIGRGEKLTDIMASMTAVAEGVLTSKSAAALADSLGVDVPIIKGIYRVLHQGADPEEVVASIMTRDLKNEVHPSVALATGRPSQQ